MRMLMRILGQDYIVSDEACTIRFKRLARETLFADLKLRARSSTNNKFFTLPQSKTIFAPRRQPQKAIL